MVLLWNKKSRTTQHKWGGYITTLPVTNEATGLFPEVTCYKDYSCVMTLPGWMRPAGREKDIPRPLGWKLEPGLR